jgi:hypothetical protein
MERAELENIAKQINLHIKIVQIVVIVERILAKE